MPLLVLTAIVQICFVIHVVRTGRPYYWALIILSFPVIGCVIYYFVEVFPNSREHRSARRAAAGIARALQPDAQFKRRVEEAETCGSVDNKAALAQECLRMGFTEDAVRLYQSCLTGPHAGDPQLLFGLTQAQFAHQQLDQAGTTLARLRSAHPAFKPEDSRLLHARILEGQGREEEAQREYEELVEVYVGLEAKVRYAQLLRHLGYEKQANSVFEAIVDYARRTRIMHEGEREWLAVAKRSIQPSH